MGNCQAAEAATVVIQHPGNKVERIYWSVSARQVMSSNPGHYVALVLTSPVLKLENGMPAKQLKLLRPDDTLRIGQVYRLVSVEDVLKEFAAKKCVKLGKLLKERGALDMEEKKTDVAAPPLNPKPNSRRSSVKTEEEEEQQQQQQQPQQQQEVNRGGNSSSSSRDRVVGRHQHGGGGVGQWKPALQSIAEIGT